MGDFPDAVYAAMRQVIYDDIQVDHVGWYDEIRSLPVTVLSTESGFKHMKEAYLNFSLNNQSSEGLQTRILINMDDERRGAKVTQLLSKLTGLHLGTVLETAKTAKAISTGLIDLLAKPEYSGPSAKGSAVRGFVSEFFSESMQEAMAAQGLSRLVSHTEWWENWEEIQKAGEFFDTNSLKTISPLEVLEQNASLSVLSLIAVSPQMQAAFHLLSPVGRGLYAAVTKFLSGHNVTGTAVVHRLSHPAAPTVRNMLRFNQQGPEAIQVEKDLIRWVQRLKLLVHMELHVLCTLWRLQVELMEHQGWRISIPAFATEDVFPEIRSAIETRFSGLSDDKEWNFGLTYQPGATATPVGKTASSVSASDGMRFLESQMRNKSSNYRMPKAGSAQQDWLHWCTTVENFISMFPTPHQIVIENLTTGVADDDVRIYGWKARCERYALEQKKWGVPEFLSHVRGQVLSTVTTRKAAWEELQALERDYTELSDCIALSTRLRKLYQQIYDVTSTEVEPISRLHCIRRIHALMTMLHTRSKWHTPIAKAWRGFTQFDATELFVKFIHQDKHTPDATEKLCSDYLVEICSQLTTAHDIFTQMDMSASTSSRSTGRGEVNSFSFSRGRGRQSSNSNRSAGSNQGKRSRSQGTDRSGASARSNRGRTDGRPAGQSSGRGGGRSGSHAAEGAKKDASFADCVRLLSKMEPRLAPPALRKLAGFRPEMEHEDCIEGYRGGPLHRMSKARSQVYNLIPEG